MVIAVTIDELETFVSIARRGGFARAAESRRRSQPATRFAGMLRQFGQRHPSVKLDMRTANSRKRSTASPAGLGKRLFFDGAAAFAFLNHRGQIVGRADFPGTHFDAGVIRDQLNRVIQVPGL